jgi:hypothetical protein
MCRETCKHFVTDLRSKNVLIESTCKESCRDIYSLLKHVTIVWSTKLVEGQWTNITEKEA